METNYYYKSPIGTLYISFEDGKLTSLTMSKDGEEENEIRQNGEANLTELPNNDIRAWLDTYFSGREPESLPQVSLKGTPFQLSVWEILLTLPYGTTTTYGEIANELARKSGKKHLSAQAVGQAVGHNPIGIIVPCHRVVGKNGSLTGYAWGTDKKERLLKLEKCVLPLH